MAADGDFLELKACGHGLAVVRVVSTSLRMGLPVHLPEGFNGSVEGIGETAPEGLGVSGSRGTGLGRANPADQTGSAPMADGASSWRGEARAPGCWSSRVGAGAHR